MIMKDSLLEKRGYVTVHYPYDLVCETEALVNKWKKFCQLDQCERDKASFFDGSGYELNKRDDKEVLDLNLRNINRLLTIKGLTMEARETILCGGNLLDGLITRVAKEFASRLEKDFSLQGLERGVMLGKSKWKLRLIHYFPKDTGVIVAKHHPDKSGFTLHLHENRPGLQYLDWQKEGWHDITFSDRKSVIFNGMQMQRFSENLLKALCHRIVEKGGVDDRYSAVCFVGIYDTPWIDPRGKKMQNYPKGFNYDMDLEELKKLFTSYSLAGAQTY